MTVIVRNLHKEDVGTYRCIAKNSLGEVESNIRIYGELEGDTLRRIGRGECKMFLEIPGPTRLYAPLDEEDYNEQFGSAENDEDVVSNSVSSDRANRIVIINTGSPPRDGGHQNHVPVDSVSNGDGCFRIKKLHKFMFSLVLWQVVRLGGSW